ncbi:hypothetical protein ACQ4PT_061150 [Festuca glaucescens]
MGGLVSTNQSAFIKGRCLHDNFVLVRQVARRINQKRQTGVLVKLDISRAFDSISWAFLLEVLRHLGFGVLFLKWVSLLLFTASTKVSVNGVPGERIQHARGLRQGDPTSPLLYVIGMEVLTCMIVNAVEQHLFSPLAGITPMQRISVYADDVVLFVKENESELRVVKEILELFGEASGLKVNYSKTTATVIRGNEESRIRVQETLQCELAEFPLKYLGLQLALRPLTKAQWQPLLDGMIKWIPAWQRGMIARSGRLILIKSVVTARSIHQFLVAEAPDWMLEELDR